MAPQWDNVVAISKDIREKTLRNVKEVKEELTKHEWKITPKFNAFLILSKDMESIV